MADVRAPDYKDKTDESASPPPRAPGGRITPVLEPNEARQGATHHNVRYVLGVSLAVVIVAMAVAYFAFFPRTTTLEETPPPDTTTLPAPEPGPATVPPPG